MAFGFTCLIGVRNNASKTTSRADVMQRMRQLPDVQMRQRMAWFFAFDAIEGDIEHITQDEHQQNNVVFCMCNGRIAYISDKSTVTQAMGNKK